MESNNASLFHKIKNKYIVLNILKYLKLLDHIVFRNINRMIRELIDLFLIQLNIKECIKLFEKISNRKKLYDFICENSNDYDSEYGYDYDSGYDQFSENFRKISKWVAKEKNLTKIINSCLKKHNLKNIEMKQYFKLNKKYRFKQILIKKNQPIILKNLFYFYILGNFKFSNRFENQIIKIWGDKMTLKNNNIRNEKLIDKLSILYDIKKLKLIDNFGFYGKLKSAKFIQQLSIDYEYLVVFNNHVNFSRDYPNLKSIGTLEYGRCSTFEFMESFADLDIEKLKIKREYYKNETFGNWVEMSELASALRDNYPLLRKIYFTNWDFLNNYSNSNSELIKFFDELYCISYKYEKIKLKNFMNKMGRFPDQKYQFRLHELAINCKNFKLEGGDLKNFNLASDFLNVNTNIEKFVLKNVDIKEQDFLEFLEGITSDSNISIIKTNIKYSEKIFAKMALINKELNRNIILRNY